MKKFKHLLFIDDNHHTNFYHNEIAKEAGVADQLVFFQKAKEALEYLNKSKENQESLPELIFIDINMPGIDGWEFTELYGENIGKSSSNIIILTTSLNPSDQEKAENNQWVSEFRSKPLSVEVFDELRSRYLN